MTRPTGEAPPSSDDVELFLDMVRRLELLEPKARYRILNALAIWFDKKLERNR